MNSQKQTYSQVPKKKLVSRSFIIGLSLVFILPAGLVGAFGAKCKVQQYMHKANKHDVIQVYENLKLTSATSDIKKEVQLGGCFDSGPWIRAEQSYSVNATGSELVAEFRNNMKIQGYNVTNEMYRSSSCGTEYFANAGNGPINISFLATDYPLDSGCDSYLSRKTPETPPSSKMLNNVYSTLLNQ